MSKPLSPPMVVLLTEIETFLETHGLNEREFGTLAMGDFHLVPQIRAGRQLRYENEQRVRVAMEILGRQLARKKVANG